VTRERLYLETMESVLGDNSKVLIDAPQGNTMMYLPLDQMLKGRSAPAPAGSPQPQARVAPEPEPTPERAVNRDRRTR
jgi:membrane protease subunit HflK